MYCELGGDVCGEIGRLGHEKEVVCIVSWEGMYVRRSGALGTRERGCMYCEWGRGVCEEIGALGTREGDCMYCEWGEGGGVCGKIDSG